MDQASQPYELSTICNWVESHQQHYAPLRNVWKASYETMSNISVFPVICCIAGELCVVKFQHRQSGKLLTLTLTTRRPWAPSNTLICPLIIRDFGLSAIVTVIPSLPQNKTAHAILFPSDLLTTEHRAKASTDRGRSLDGPWWGRRRLCHWDITLLLLDYNYMTQMKCISIQAIGGTQSISHAEMPNVLALTIAL